MRSTVEKICQFLGKKLEPEELNSVLKNSSFQAMKENSMSNYSLLKGQYFEENGQLLRKGKENILPSKWIRLCRDYSWLIIGH
jgi:bile-salt sulfotransferase